MKRMILEDLLHTVLIGTVACVLLAATACASAPDITPTRDTFDNSVLTEIIAMPAPVCEPIDYSELIGLDAMSPADLEERGRRDMFQVFREYVLEQCMQTGCSFVMPDFNRVNMRLEPLEQAATP